VEGGNLVQRSWWKYYEPSLAPTFATELISVDAAFKGTTESDFVAITVWGKIENDYYLRYCLNRQMTFTETLQALRLTQKLYPYARRVLIEDKANGSAIIDVLQKEMFCIPVNPKGGKEARVNAVSPAIESGHVYLPSGEPWVEGFINQFALFPAGAHDDMVDSATQALSFMLFSTGYVPAPAPVEVKEIRTAKEKEEHTFLGPELYDVYGTKDGWTS
jgi:predicted phage terminase large subunit-like protein